MQRKLKICSSCKKECFIFSKKMCLYCYNKNKDYKLKSNKTINKISDNQKKRIEKYNELKELYFKNNSKCEFIDENGIPCNSTEIELHHKGGRVGKNMFNYFMSCCRYHHQYIHNNPEWSYKQNYLI